MSDQEIAIVMGVLGLSMFGVGLIFGFLLSLKRIEHLNRTLEVAATEFVKQSEELNLLKKEYSKLFDRNIRFANKLVEHDINPDED